MATTGSAQDAKRQWIVDNSVAATGDGSPSSPFTSLAEAVRAAGEAEVIVVRGTEKPYRGGIALRSGQSLIGEGSAPILESDTDVIRIEGTTGSVDVVNVAVRATTNAKGVVVRNARGPITLRDVTITTTAGEGLSVQTVDRLIVQGGSSITSVDAPAAAIREATLDVVFRRISASGANLERGIVLEKTSGSFVVEGGTIEGAAIRAVSAIGASNVTLRALTLRNSARTNVVAGTACGGDLGSGHNRDCNAAVYLQDVAGATLEGVVIDGSGQAGLAAHGVTDLSLLRTEIRGAGDELSEHGIVLQDMSGECRIVDSTIARSASRHLMLHNSGGKLRFLTSGSTFGETAPPHGQQGILVVTAGTAEVEVRVEKTTMEGSFSHALDVIADGEARVAVHVTGSRIAGGASAISISADHAGRAAYVIEDNEALSGGGASAINLFLGVASTGSVSGTIARNTIGKSGVRGSGAQCESCNGITMNATGRATLTAAIEGNVIQQVGGAAISGTVGQGHAQLNTIITANLLRQPAGSDSPAIRLQAGTLRADATVLCADIGGPGAAANTIEGTWEANGAIHLLHRFEGARFQLAGLTATSDAAATAAAIAARNRGARVRAVLRPDAKEKGFEPAARCAAPEPAAGTP